MNPRAERGVVAIAPGATNGTAPSLPDLLKLAQDYEKRLQELERDAARYRWLRRQGWNEAELCAVAWPAQAVKLGHDCPSLDRLDTAIDAAIAKEEQESALDALVEIGQEIERGETK